MASYTRRIDISILVDKWDWSNGKLKDTSEIRDYILSYRFQKSIKSPKGTCQIELIPQTESVHGLDYLSPMDVVRIYEFGALKFIGYIRRISYSGSIGGDGKPNRKVIITASQYGGIFIDAQTGMGMGTALGNSESELFNYTKTLVTKIYNASQDGITHKEMIELIIEQVLSYLENLGMGSSFRNYVTSYITIGPGLSTSPRPFLPRTFEMFSGTEYTLSLWTILERLIESPFNELFIDNGPRNIYLDGKKKEFSSETSTVVFRETPFDGTVGGSSDKLFSSMEPVIIKKSHLVQFDLSKSMDEAYSLYTVKHAAFEFNDNVRLLTGRWKIDEGRLGKYLFKPLVTQMFYTRLEKTDSKEQNATKKDYEDEAINKAETLKNWFQKNDEYLSGAITMMVPSDHTKDPKIGEKISVDGITGSFYVEGIAHSWTYGGPLKSNLTVTRGYNRDSNTSIKLKDRIFYRSTMK